MDYEKAYKEALERAKEKHDEYIRLDNDNVVPKDIEYIFPELAESKDERIRKELIEYFRWNSQGQLLNDFSNREVFDWFEKQGEQKITNSKEDIDFTIYYPLKNGNGKYECIPYSFYGSLTSFSDNEDLIDFLHNCFYTKQKCEDWIKKQDEQKPTWSEEDEEMLESIITCTDKDFFISKEQINWLKSLKPQNKWKPSEYDISLLEEIARNIRNNIRPFCSEVSSLEALIDTLKNL